jgi:hypothetical protein
MIATALNWIRRKYDAIRQKFEAVKKALSPPTNTKTSEPDEAAEVRRKLDNAVESLPDYFANLAKGLSENAHLKRFIDAGASFRKSGQYAGLWGIREPEIGDIAEMQVQITKSRIEEDCLSTQRKLNSESKILKTIKKNAERDYRTKHAYYEKLNRAYQYNHRNFSLLLCVIYGFFAFVLVLADIPLALELTRRGFNLKSDPNNSIQSLFSLATPDGFFVHFAKVLTSNWEVVLFATGVAFCTIYIKIFYDDFIGAPLENLIKKASEAPPANYEEFHLAQDDEVSNDGAEAPPKEALNKEDIDKQFHRLWRVRFRVKLGVLVVLFSTILVLGYFRYWVVSANRVADIPAYVTFFTYSLMTLIFPIISGICASLSLSSFHNWSERRKAKKQNSAAREAVMKATDDYRQKAAEREKNEAFINWLRHEDTIKHLKNYLVRCYGSGYKFGYLYTEWTFGGDLFTRAEALRNRNLTDPTVSLNGFDPLKSPQPTHLAMN